MWMFEWMVTMNTRKTNCKFHCMYWKMILLRDNMLSKILMTKHHPEISPVPRKHTAEHSSAVRSLVLETEERRMGLGGKRGREEREKKGGREGEQAERIREAGRRRAGNRGKDCRREERSRVVKRSEESRGEDGLAEAPERSSAWRRGAEWGVGKSGARDWGQREGRCWSMNRLKPTVILRQPELQRLFSCLTHTDKDIKLKQTRHLPVLHSHTAARRHNWRRAELAFEILQWAFLLLLDSKGKYSTSQVLLVHWHACVTWYQKLCNRNLFPVRIIEWHYQRW